MELAAGPAHVESQCDHAKAEMQSDYYDFMRRLL